MDIPTGIRAIIENMPLILEYFVPGYFTIFAYRRFKGTGKNAMSDAIHLGMSVCISYFLHIIFANIPNNIWRCFIETLFGICFAIILLKLIQTSYVREMFSKVNNTFLSETTFDSCDLYNLHNVTIHQEHQKVIGRLLSYNLDSDDAWLVLDYYRIESNDGNEELENWEKSDKYKRCLIPASSVQYITVAYREDKDYIYPSDYKHKLEERRKKIKQANEKEQ